MGLSAENIAFRLAQGAPRPGLSRVLEVVDALIPGIEQLAGEATEPATAPKGDQVETWLRDCRALQPEATDPKQLIGHITEAPGWAAMLAQSTWSGVGFLQSILAACLLGSPQLANGNDSPTTEQAGLFIRNLVSRKHGPLQSATQESLVIPEGEVDLAKAIAALRSAVGAIPVATKVAAQDRARQGFLNFIRLSEFAFTDRQKRERKTEAREVTSLRPPPDRTEDWPVDPRNPARVTKLYEDKPSAETTRSRQASAAPLREGTNRISAEVRATPHARQNTREAIRQAVTRARLIVSESQQLPYASNRLQLVDLQAFFRWAGQLDNQRNPGGVEGDWRRALGMLAVLTGRNGKTILDTAVTPKLPTLQELRTSTHRGILVVLEPATLILTNPVPADRFVPKDNEAEFYEPVLPAILIPLPTSLPGVKGLLALAKRHPNGLFPDKSIWKRYQQDVLEIGKRARLQLTPLRVAAIVSRLIVDVNHDHADGAFFSREDYEDGCAARLYYYAPRMAGLVKQYITMWNFYQTAASAGASARNSSSKISPAKTTWSWQTIPAPYADWRVGSAGCPQIEHVKHFVSALQSDLKKLGSKTGRRTASDLIELHNLFTAFTIHMTLWTLGIRAIREPIEIQLLDLEEGFIGISDKDGDEYADARAAWLPEPLRKQLMLFQEHRRLMLASELLEFTKPPGSWLFFLDDQTLPSQVVLPGEAVRVKPVLAKPESLRSHCGREYPFRNNSHRHFVRTYLRELGVPGTDVDALLGHGSIGERPYAKYSCYSPMKLKRAAEEAMEKLISMLGWKLQHGLITEKSWHRWNRSSKDRRVGDSDVAKTS